MRLPPRDPVFRAQERAQRPLRFDDVHRVDFFTETVVVFGRTEMQFADGGHLVPRIADPVMQVGTRPS